MRALWLARCNHKVSSVAEYVLLKMEGYFSFLFFLVSSLVLGFTLVIFALVWVLHYSDGLAWDGGNAEFNWHPVLIITGFIFIEGIGMCNLI